MKIGDKVQHVNNKHYQPNLGSGTIVGEEFVAWHRWLVLLDDPSKWARSASSNNIACFFDYELEVIV